MIEEKIYKIKNQEGLFSTGGQSPTFSKIGKTWNNFRALKCHLAIINSRIEKIYEKCEIVVYKTTITENTTNEDKFNLKFILQEKIIKAIISTYSSRKFDELKSKFINIMLEGTKSNLIEKIIKNQEELNNTKLMVLIPKVIVENYKEYQKGINNVDEYWMSKLLLETDNELLKLYGLI